jgi:hypothetical protein
MKKNYTGNTTKSQYRYGFPTNMKDIHSLTLQHPPSSRKLLYVSAREFDAKVPRVEQITEGISAYYVDYGVNFELFRIPNAVYQMRLRCSVYPSDLTTDGATSDLRRKDALICATATMFGFLSLRELEDATYWKNEVIAPLFQSSLESDHSAEDWSPIARGFDTRRYPIGDYVSNPLVRSMP